MVPETPPLCDHVWTGTLGEIIPTLPHISSTQRHSTQINSFLSGLVVPLLSGAGAEA